MNQWSRTSWGTIQTLRSRGSQFLFFFHSSHTALILPVPVYIKKSVLCYKNNQRHLISVRHTPAFTSCTLHNVATWACYHLVACWCAKAGLIQSTRSTLHCLSLGTKHQCWQVPGFKYLYLVWKKSGVGASLIRTFCVFNAKGYPVYLNVTSRAVTDGLGMRRGWDSSHMQRKETHVTYWCAII